MIRFSTVTRGGGLGPEIVPAFVCDLCKQPIVEQGNALFMVDDHGGRTGEYLVVHQGCEVQGTRLLPWQPLDEFVFELWANARFDWDAVKARRVLQRQLIDSDEGDSAL